MSCRRRRWPSNLCMGDVATTICIRRLVGIVSALNVLSINQSLDSFLDHVNVRLESGSQLLDGFGHELLMGEVLPLSGRIPNQSLLKNQGSQGDSLHDPHDGGLNLHPSVFISPLLRIPPLLAVFELA